MLHHRMTPPKPLPPFRSYRDVSRAVAGIVRPKQNLSGSEWARRMLNYDFGALPWHAEVLNALTDSATAEVPLMGPSQIGKSEIGLAWSGYCIERQPGPFLFCQQSRNDADDFEKRRFKPFIRQHRVISDCLLDDNNADNVHLKQFRGMVLSIGWPVPGYFTARPVRYGWLDDFDQFPADIGGTEEQDGQGDAWGLLDGRMPSFEGREVKFASSSPARDDGSGIEALIVESTDERLMPECPCCGERVEFDTIRDLKFEGKTADEAAESAHVVCPANGCILQPEDKFRLFASMARLPNAGFVAKRPELGQRRRGFRIDGLFGMRSWSEMARKWREAQIEFERRQDEAKLRTFYNTVAGKNYRSQILGEKPLEADDLSRLKDSHWRLGTVPQGPVVISVSVDIQSDRFECEAVGYADGMESWIIDRWAIDVLEDGLTQVDPFRKPEHWRVLLPLFDKTWPLAGLKGVRSPKPLVVAIDTGGGGEKNVATATENAKKFWHLATAGGVARSRIMLLKGSSNHNSELIGRARPSDQKSKGGFKRNSPELWLVNVHRAKFVLDARLRRQENGPGRIHLPSDFELRWQEEFTAEQLNKKGKWAKVRERNETLDLTLYAWFGLIKPPFMQSRSNMRWVPHAFRVLLPKNAEIADDDDGAAVDAVQAEQAIAKAAAKPVARKRKRSTGQQSWMARLNRKY